MSFKMAHSLEDLAEGIGKYKGLADGISQNEYMDGLIKQAFKVADRRFNEVAAVAAKGRNFEHMYEFYTRKVHDNGQLSHTAQSSRLWKTTLVGGGGRKLISFEFLPAKRPRTELTEEETGVDADVLKRLAVNNGRKYRWRNKAENTENMKTIFIKPREAKVLFIPTIQGLNDATAKEKLQGFGFRKAYANEPGEWTGGGNQFTEFFWEYWQTGGKEAMETAMIEKFNKDIRGFNKFLKVNPSALKPTANIDGTVQTNRGKTMKQWTIKARNSAGVGEVVS